MERTPRPGEFYRHFKDKMYQVIAVAIHSETREKMVVYQALYGTFDVYVRPLSMFTSEVDHEKYPDVLQKYRFERVDLAAASDESQPEEEQKEETTKKETTKEEHDGPNKNLLAFLDAETYYEKLEVLRTLKDKFTAEELLAICEIMDIGRADSEPEEKYYAVERYLELQIKYDGTRLR
ncbi:DUF1653 domain-containing protein [Clostridium boliviensis]|uniref:DUF1653 domain-containing protein n=1 Tax=Clostridium boliviensis TaxID=318465 RepID=A0ABU4GIL5_9CLOT|nr:DUF1653 domain-containing protein [Clostridium boliviensis]MDW2797456.1 DUF1653 domain-containing protein [Clostridium boliviensis]